MFGPKPAIYGAQTIRVSRRYFGPRLGQDDGREGPGIMTPAEWYDAREKALRRFADLERRFQAIPPRWRPAPEEFSARAFQLRNDLRNQTLRQDFATIAQEDMIMHLNDELDNVDPQIQDAEYRWRAEGGAPGGQSPAGGAGASGLPQWAVPAALGMGVLALIGVLSA